MDSKLIFYPVVFQIILTFYMYVRLAVLKARAIGSSEVDLTRRALHNDAWPDYVIKSSNNVQNQFESPVLFYALCFMLWAIDAVSVLVLVLAWAYVVLRIIHVVVHTGTNYVPVRKKVFIISTLVLMSLCLSLISSMLLN